MTIECIDWWTPFWWGLLLGLEELTTDDETSDGKTTLDETLTMMDSDVLDVPVDRLLSCPQLEEVTPTTVSDVMLWSDESSKLVCFNAVSREATSSSKLPADASLGVISSNDVA